MLHVEGLRKSFDGFVAVNDARLDVERGDIVAVIGPNGAGKTTLFKLISGHLPPDRGKILFKDHDISGLPPYEICRLGISLSFQVVNVFSRMSVFENVQVAVISRLRKSAAFLSPASHYGVAETMSILESVGLTQKSEQISGALSHGEQKVLELAIALGTRPELLILDEPTAGMSPEETSETMQLIQRLSSELGLTVLFCEHDMELVFAIADKIMVMHQGQTLIQGTPEEVRGDKKVQDAYLGEG